MNKPQKTSRKELLKHIKKLEEALVKYRHFIDTECTTKGEVTRMYATMRVAIVAAYGEEGIQKVLDQFRELKQEEAKSFASEATEIFGEDYEKPKFDKSIDIQTG